jgi:hypothetical protein
LPPKQLSICRPNSARVSAASRGGPFLESGHTGIYFLPKFFNPPPPGDRNKKKRFCCLFSFWKKGRRLSGRVPTNVPESSKTALNSTPVQAEALPVSSACRIARASSGNSSGFIRKTAIPSFLACSSLTSRL